MGPQGRPEAEVAIDAGLVEALLASQHPDIVGAVRAVASGWDNAVFRLGDDLAVRLPRRALGAELVEREARWLPKLATVLDQVPLAVPVPVRQGRPGLGYPFPWTIVRWVPGATALHADVPLDEAAAVTTLARLLGALWSTPAPADAPRNPYRGVPLAERSALVIERLDRLPADIDPDPVAEAWDRATSADPHRGPDAWVHGDLHPGNLVVEGGRLTGVIDWGDLCGGDPATDLSVAWMVLGPSARSSLLTTLAGVDEAAWSRACGNALAHAVAVLAASADDVAMERMGRRTLAAVLSDD